MAITMTPADFRAFRKRFGWTQARAASELGVSKRQWQAYESGEQKIVRERLMRLAMSAVAMNLPPYGGER